MCILLYFGKYDLVIYSNRRYLKKLVLVVQSVVLDNKIYLFYTKLIFTSEDIHVKKKRSLNWVWVIIPTAKIPTSQNPDGQNPDSPKSRQGQNPDSPKSRHGQNPDTAKIPTSQNPDTTEIPTRPKSRHGQNPDRPKSRHSRNPDNKHRIEEIYLPAINLQQ